MNSKAVLLVLGLACTCVSAQDVESPLGLDDFAYTMTIEVGRGSPIQTLLIPQSVYKILVRSDLGDLRVFAADGSQVSHALRRMDKDRVVRGKSLDLKLFPLTGAKVGSPGDDLQIVVKRSDKGKVVSVAYYGAFVSGGGDRPIVVSYASSPPAEIVYADPPVTESPTGVVTDTCFRQVEFAGILAGTQHRAASEALIDFMLTPVFQEDLPLSMFVYPAVTSTVLPRVFIDHVYTPVTPHLSLIHI